MDRRKFIASSALTSIAVPAIISSSCTFGDKKESANLSEKDNFLLNEITILELQQKMSSGRLTAKEITELYLKRIKQIDNNGPKLNAIIELNTDALEIAEMMDKERQAGKLRGLMHGIPVLIKDNIETADKMSTSAGSLALEGYKARKDAFIIEKLRASGAVILGKTNLSEWANFRSTRSSSGWSSRGGQTRNPFQLDRSPCGSSSGSAVAVSANLCAVAVGTETNGSIACPASVNGIVGIKPTVGLLSRYGVIPISRSQDTAGPMARTVTDAVILLCSLTGEDAQDNATINNSEKTKNYMQFLNLNGLKGKRIGIEKSFLKGHEGVDKLFHVANEMMKNHDATVIEIELFKELKGIDNSEFELLKVEFKDGINKFLKDRGINNISNLKDLIDFNKRNSYREMRYFKQEIFEDALSKKGIESDEYKKLFENTIIRTRNAIDNILISNSLDAICGPANGPSCCIDLINGDFFSGYGTYSPAAIAGYPAITVPMGMVHELPVGLTFFGKSFNESTLIEIAFSYEQHSKKRIAPWFKKSFLS